MIEAWTKMKMKVIGIAAVLILKMNKVLGMSQHCSNNFTSLTMRTLRYSNVKQSSLSQVTETLFRESEFEPRQYDSRTSS